MRIVTACTLALTLGACGTVSSPPPDTSTYNRDEAKQIIDAQTHCFTREAQDKSLNKVNINTAALAVQAKCVEETQRFKAFSARTTIDSVTGGVPGFEARMRQAEADDLQYIRQVLAVIRTSK